MSDNEDARGDGAVPAPGWTRWDLLRDVVVFQLKLALDGTRDLLLAPVSIITAIGGLLSGGENPGRPFYELLRWGHRTDRWISLFTAADDKFPSLPSKGDAHDMTLDTLVARVEGVVRDKRIAGSTVPSRDPNPRTSATPWVREWFLSARSSRAPFLIRPADR